MKNKKSNTPKNKSAIKQKIVEKKKQKISNSSIQNLAIVKFMDDVKEGDLDKFDVTTVSGFLKELLTRIRKVDVTGLGSQLAF
ncbi:hypothetical protein J4G37_60240, partial [Microvirga sp. 3-52]|nr:hypothetical protein [Microvirga sp. 3-52]